MTSTEHHYSQQIDEGALIAGRYRLARWLGLGATGEVWAARDERLGRDVAVKLVLGDPSADPQTADRFTREAIAVARITHPNVVAVYDQGEYQRHQFVVMELVTGCNLDELRGGRPMPIGAALAIGVQISRALEAAHEAAVLHRDIKPANIMVNHDGVVKVLDFGIAGFLQGAGFTERLTRTGADSLGTPAYTAPERIMGAQADVRSDLYSVGCVLYVLLTGLPPFPADDSLTILHRHLHDEPTPVRRWRPEVAPEIDQLVLWLLAKDPAARPASAAIVAGRLESLAMAYPNADITREQTLDELFGATTATQPVPFVELDLEQDADPGAGRGGERAGRGSAKNGRDAAFVRTGRKRHAPAVFLAVSVVAGLALGVVLSRQAMSSAGTVIGAMPSADALHVTRTAAGAMPGNGQAAKPAGTGTGAGASAATSSAAATNMAAGAGGGATTKPTASAKAVNQGATSNVTPNAPITPYLRYTAAAAGTGGCAKLAPGQFECTVGRADGAPVFQAGTLDRAGAIAPGPQPFYCQSSGAQYSFNGFHNHWWAWTESAQGTFGWVSAVDLAGGSDDQPEPGLPFCGN
ncbi:serine/threonine protein kinase [Actinocrinis puniceicyclus]|uniref:non-specific serine/threonine protein kinase n=1 Tax=Actinocrinis puniceicyclus TaxID=977794 RepID=A0A8J7WRN3_9ACTN|nr:protein kinase [Actinocrinis puniceicyclus]MBS2964757.1 serine/threonine protein kinase [Actinocrinis puniceicyclus]